MSPAALSLSNVFLFRPISLDLILHIIYTAEATFSAVLSIFNQTDHGVSTKLIIDHISTIK